jgi:hypothetical protein
MTYISQSRPFTRAPRVNLRGSVSALIRLENGQQIQAKLHTLSVTGGLLEIASYLAERSKVDLTVAIGSGVVRPQAEMLFPMVGPQGYLQPFRFTRLWAEERQMLATEIASLLQQTVARSMAGLPAGPVPSRFKLESF